MTIEVMNKIEEIMKEVFDLDELTISNETTAADVESWDSMNHVRLIVAVEEDFGITMPMELVSELQNVKELVNLVASLSD